MWVRWAVVGLGVGWRSRVFGLWRDSFGGMWVAEGAKGGVGGGGHRLLSRWCGWRGDDGVVIRWGVSASSESVVRFGRGLFR